MMHNDNMSREDELLFLLMEGKLEYNTEEYATVISELLDLIFSSNSVAKVALLCNSERLISIRAGAWLASNLGKKAVPIYPDIVGLIKHEDAVVRYEIAELILNCSDKGEDLVEFVHCLDDKEKIIRTRAIDYLHFLSAEQINKALAFAEENAMNEVAGALSEFNNVINGDIAIEEINLKLGQYSRVEKMVVFAALLKLEADKSYLKNFVDKSKNDDLKRYYEHYISD